jgi:dihydroflavonol-4-reductase
MAEINPQSPVMVTGATGYIAGWLVKMLLEQGHTVHATVRDASNQAKLKMLNSLAEELPGEIRFFSADLLDAASFDEAMAGCELVFHTASPFAIQVKDPQRDLVDPAVSGTRNVLEAAKRTPTVKRVVVTSSCAAICGDSIDLQETKSGVFTEDDWNTTSSVDHQPYNFSKVEAEREAWKVAGTQDRWDLVTINPSFVLGPAIDPQCQSESFDQMTAYGDGQLKAGVPNMTIGIVDVRDVARAHCQAGFTPSASGRYIISGTDSGFWGIAEILAPEFGDRYPIPKKILPKWLLWLVGPIVTKGLFTRKVVSRNLDLPWKADNSKSRDELGVVYRPMKESVTEMFQQLIDAGRI